MASRIMEKYRYTLAAEADPSWSACSISDAPMDSQYWVNFTASFKSVAPPMGLPQMVLTVPHILIPASVHFWMQCSASFQ